MKAFPDAFWGLSRHDLLIEYEGRGKKQGDLCVSGCHSCSLVPYSEREKLEVGNRWRPGIQCFILVILRLKNP